MLEDIYEVWEEPSPKGSSFFVLHKGFNKKESNCFRNRAIAEKHCKALNLLHKMEMCHLVEAAERKIQRIKEYNEKKIQDLISGNSHGTSSE